ncbi:MAG: Ig-like domain-containing protein [Clostridia bacterium]|nr:Ig-like domain-containing protein [Clostridia bacterium]
MLLTRSVKKILSIFLAIVLLFGIFVFVPKVEGVVYAADSGYYAWSGYSTYLKGAGTDTNPFLISSPSDLAYFRKQVALSTGTITYYSGNDTTTAALTKKADNACYKLTCDIYYNDPNGDEWKNWSSGVKPTNGGDAAHTWTPPGYADETNRRFEGQFDGNGFTIYGMYIVHTSSNCVGFIGTARYANIKDLTLAKGYVEGANLTGGFVGQAKVGVDIVNCVSNMRVVGASGVGGFVGGNAKNGSYLETDIVITNEATSPSIAIYNCENQAQVNGNKWVGGVLGYVSSGASRVQIEKCTNNAPVSCSVSAVGGILGGTRQVDGYGHNVVESCINNGAVSGGASGYTAGIVGCGRAIEIYNCVNKGNVNNKNTANYTAGISGGSNTADGLANGVIVNCYNSGTIIGSGYSAGIVGCAKSININGCANEGDVTGTTNVGGISGRSGGASDKRDTELYNCYNTGTITSTNNSPSVAGIVGEAYFEGTVDDNKYVKVKRSFNYGSVSSGRAIAYSNSTVKNSEGTGIYVYTEFANTCFGLTGINSNFDGGTPVNSLCSDEVLALLNSNVNNSVLWEASFPFPTLVRVEYNLQSFGGRTQLFNSCNVRVSNAPALDISVGINTAGEFYNSISTKKLSYGVLAAKSEALDGAVLKANTDIAVKYEGSINENSLKASISGQSADDYDDLYTLRPYVSFVENGQTIYIYGDAVESSYYTADGAINVPAVNESAAFTCEEKLYVLVGGTKTMDYSFASASREDSISFISSDTSVATVSKGKVTGVSEGTATITVTYTGDWGAKTLYCQVKVLSDLTETVFANQYAQQDDNFRIHTNEIQWISKSLSKNDGTVMDYNGTVLMIDSGNQNSKSLDYLLELREEFLKDGLASGTITEEQYYRLLLSDKCQIQIISFITHWHSDHIYALRYYISKSPYVNIKKMYTTKDPAGTSANGYDAYLNGFDTMVNNCLTYSPDLVPTQIAFETEKTRYFSNYNTLSTTDTSYPVTVTICTSKDWSTHSTLSKDSTEWENCSSTWYLIEVAGVKLLFTGDTFPNDVGTTYKGNNTSGSTAVDYMLYLHKDIVNTDVDFLDSNHHGRGSYVENLYTATQPSILYAGIYFGQDDVKVINSGVKTADVYLGGDQPQVFVIDSAGNINTDGALLAYPKNTSGHAIRNHITLHFNRDLPVKQPTTEKIQATGIKLSANTLTVPCGTQKWLAATVLGENTTDKNVVWTISDPTVLSTDGGYVKGLKSGTVTVTASCGVYSASCTVTVVKAVGDLNLDGLVSTVDYAIMRKIVSGDTIATQDIITLGDLNEDRILNTTDLAIIRNIISGD